MTILAIHSGNGITKDMYENARKEVNWEGNPPPGVIFHAASFDDSGNNIRVTDIWESEEQWKNFLNTRLLPHMQKAQVPPLRTEIFQIHNINAYAGIDSHRIR